MCRLIHSNVDLEKVIAFIERSIEQERVIMKTHKVLHNDIEALESDQDITHVERLLSFLRRCGPP